MVFSSLYFLYLFLPVCLLCYGLSPSLKIKNFTLTVFSLLFYAWGEPTYIILLLISVLMNYLFGLGIGGCQKRGKAGGAKFIMTVSLIFNIGLLGVFKYSGFIVENLNLIPGVSLPVPKLTLPIGISFYTFQILSYIIDLYWEKIDVQKNPFHLLLYISMFPQLIAGPIVRYATIADEIKERKTTLLDLSEGFTRLMIGLGKKVILANHLSVIVDQFFGSEGTALSVAGTWYAVIV
ncbi:MAG: MBOAT family protein, partial [Oscillospiraceae bacterium]|nr:MBOAT family protein [Oscillospiraceae bacterium]